MDLAVLIAWLVPSPDQRSARYFLWLHRLRLTIGSVQPFDQIVIPLNTDT